MVFIDWISTPNHRNFNRAFFSALELESSSCIVFSNQLVIPETTCFLFKGSRNRVLQAINVLKLVWRKRKERIVLLTYDPLFLPFIALLKKKIFVYEHNTTPGFGVSKHSIWQSVMFNRVHRVAQYPSQYGRLVRIRKNVTYVGSPLMKLAKNYEVPKASSPPYFYLAPSYRSFLDSLCQYGAVLSDSVILAKKKVFGVAADSLVDSRFTILYLDRVEFSYQDKFVDAVIITIQSRIRGSGWFNDAISFMIPIIITDKETRMLFQETFPEYPHIFIGDVTNSFELRSAIDKIKRFNPNEYIATHNKKVRDRFLRMLSSVPA